MNNRLLEALERLFDRHRLVFWYDEKEELRKDFESLSLPEVEKLEITNNEYGLKFRILHEEPTQKFLLYHEGTEPDKLDNWLLDLQLATTVFRADQIAIWLSELGLGMEFSDVVSEHADFFRANKRKDDLKKSLREDDSPEKLRLRMLAVCAAADVRIDSILMGLLEELSLSFSATSTKIEAGEKLKLIQRFKLDTFFWEQIALHYGYHSKEPSLQDFVITLYKYSYFQYFEIYSSSKAVASDTLPFSENKMSLNADALVFLKRFKDSRQYKKCYEKLSIACEAILNIEEDLQNRDLQDLLDLDYFQLIDLKIISELEQQLCARTINTTDVERMVHQRRNSHWYEKFSHLYESINYAALFKGSLKQLNDSWNEHITAGWSLNDWIEQYAGKWFKLDQFYRKFIFHKHMSAHQARLSTLDEKVENSYSNSYLLRLNDCFQTVVDSAEFTKPCKIRRQNSFYEHWVQPYLKRGNKVCVIISDALRYEIADELLSLIRQEDRYGASLDKAISMLPSYTQLGMAALLPNKKLEVCNNASVLVDAQNSQGTANRNKILSNAHNQKGFACTASDIMAMKSNESRNLVRENNVIYVYHNRIDATGDKKDTEKQVFEAVEKTLAELIDLIKKLTGANINNLLITADHGFIYQDRSIAESDYLSGDWKIENQAQNLNLVGDKANLSSIHYLNRRFIIGENLNEHSSLRKFSSQELALSGELEFQIPKSINRLRLQGSGSSFVHGGASLQEIVIPVLKVNKKRQSDIRSVEVDILRGTNTMITAGQLSVVFYQTEAITDKIQARKLRAGIYNENGELISDSHDLVFDTVSDSPRERELPTRFILTRKADESNGQEVILKLEEKHPGTSHYKEYKSLRYTMRRSFTSDFDF